MLKCTYAKVISTSAVKQTALNISFYLALQRCRRINFIVNNSVMNIVYKFFQLMHVFQNFYSMKVKVISVC